MMLGVFALGAAALVAGAAASPIGRRSAAATPLVAYINKDAMWRNAPYSFEAHDFLPMVQTYDAVVYRSLEIDPETFLVYSSNEKALQEYEILNQYKTIKPDLKVLFSVGGDLVPSHTWSTMAANEQTRGAFIGSIKALITANGFDGVELDWVYPCSPKKTIYIQFDAESFREVEDAGGTCPDDHANLVLLLQELRTAIGEDTLITMTLPNDASLYGQTVTAVEAFVDNFMVKAYGYSVSNDPETGGSSVTAPLQPMADPGIDGIPTGNVANTIAAYDKLGASAFKVIVVMPAWGSTYYIPTVGRDEWQAHGVKASVSNECFGPYKSTHGAFPNDATHTCGVLSYNEYKNMLAKEGGPEAVQDSTTKASIGFLPNKEAFVSFTGPSAIASLVKVIQATRLGGVAIDSIDQDSFDATTLAHDFQLSIAACQAMFGVDDKRCVVTKTTTMVPPTNNTSCHSRATGSYCVDDYNFLICPQQVTEMCAPGTVCKQNTSTAIMCDWPGYNQQAVGPNRTDTLTNSTKHVISDPRRS